MYCKFHPKIQVSLICAAPHKCQFKRKMCVECQQEHGVEVKQTILMKKFY
ncbi:unnamed protein product [Paramecium pentaurelia]|uniref:Uncharacterized protein n=1 Tax=Paramecium pentaurelia TaxID=43138 RepID=A0A8S1YR04_9CILI|nr:unnamed protein product [Paramecium pentaurelia]